MAFFGASYLSVSVILILGALVYQSLRIVYRLTLHPLAKFPGPKLAAITDLYPMFYDLPMHSSYLKKLPELHDQYGPIVRAWPNGLHIRDLDAFNEIFKPGSKFVKDPQFYQFGMMEHSLFSIIDQKEAKRRKDMFAPYFSVKSISRLESLVQEKINVFFEKLDGAASSKSAVDLSLGFSCLTADVVMHYCYQKTFGALDAKDFQFPPILAIEDVFYAAPFSWYFPQLFNFIERVTKKLPEWLVKEYLPPVAATTWIQKQCRDRVLALKSSMKSRDPTISTTSTIFDIALSPDPEKNQYTPSDDGLQNDACLMFIAGTDTTANTLVQATWHVLSNPEVHAKLRKELWTAMPLDGESLLPWTTLETLPYLRGVVKESLRFSYGVPGRIPRMVPPGGTILAGRHVPAGTSVSSASYVYHTDDRLFPDANAFRPERWLGDSDGDCHDMDRKLLSFSRGPRGCLGMNLAYAQLFLTIAQLMRRFDLTLSETTAADMEWDDCYTPKTRGHLRVTVEPLSE